MKLKLTEHVLIVIFLLYKQKKKKTGETPIFRTFVAKFGIVAFFYKKSLGSTMFYDVKIK